MLGSLCARMFSALQQVVLLPQKLAPTSSHGVVDPVGASWNNVQTHGTSESWTPRYASQVQRSGAARSMPHIEHGWPMPSSLAGGGHPGGASRPTSTMPASRVPQAGFFAGDE